MEWYTVPKWVSSDRLCFHVLTHTNFTCKLTVNRFQKPWCLSGVKHVTQASFSLPIFSQPTYLLPPPSPPPARRSVNPCRQTLRWNFATLTLQANLLLTNLVGQKMHLYTASSWKVILSITIRCSFCDNNLFSVHNVRFVEMNSWLNVTGF